MFVSSVLFLWSGSRLLILSKAKWRIMHYVKSGTTPVGDKIGSFAFEKRNWSGFFLQLSRAYGLYLAGLKMGGPNGAK